MEQWKRDLLNVAVKLKLNKRRVKPQRVRYKEKGIVHSLSSQSQRKKQLDRIYERDKGICQLCGFPVLREEASRDHIISPLNGGDGKDDNNMQLAHKLCNSEKKN